MNNLKQNKYEHPHQVVHDLRSIVRSFEQYIEVSRGNVPVLGGSNGAVRVLVFGRVDFVFLW